MIVNHNGRFIDIDSPIITGRDGAWLFGDTLFETMKARQHTIHFAGQHLDRLASSARLLDLPIDREAIGAALSESVRQTDAPLSRIRLTVSRGPFSGLVFPPSEHAHFLIEVGPYPGPEENELRNGIDVVIAPNQRVNPLSHLPQMKRGNYADCLYAANHARKHGAREALFVDDNHRLLEGATSNIFLVRVLALAAEWGLITEERDVLFDDIFSADEVFICNSLIDILPVASCEGRALNQGELGHRFLSALREETDAISA